MNPIVTPEDDDDDFFITVETKPEPEPDPDNWDEKYRPKNLMDVQGYKNIKDALANFMDRWFRGIPKEKAVVLTGRNGIGKTTFAHTLGQTYGIKTIEFDISKYGREKEMKQLYMAVINEPIDDTDLKVIIIDEADNLKVKSKKILERVVKDTVHPIVITGNDAKKIPDSVKDKSLFFKMRAPDHRSIKAYLKKIVKAEKVKISDEKLIEISKKGGNYRSAINALYLFHNGIEGKIDSQDYFPDIFAVTSGIIYGKPVENREDPGLLTLFLLETITDGFDGFARYDMAEIIAMADVILSQVRHTNYRPWKWVKKILTAVTPPYPIKGHVNIKHPGTWKTRFPYNEKEAKMLSGIRGKLTKVGLTRVNRREFLRHTGNLFVRCCRGDIEMVRLLKYYADLTDTECVYLYGEIDDFSIQSSDDRIEEIQKRVSTDNKNGKPSMTGGVFDF